MMRDAAVVANLAPGAPSATTAALDTFPKMLLAHARLRPERPAMREKDYGIWQSWSWGEVAAEVEALAGGLKALGFARGDKLAIVGDNRPRLCWAIAATQALGGVPVPVYQDSKVLAYLPMAWIGEHIFSYVQAYCAGFCVSCPESGATAMTDLRELGPSYLFAPLKFFPYIKEAVAFGDGQDCVTAFINIDLDAVGNWAERRGLVYASYQELAANALVLDLVLGCIAQANRDLAAEPSLAASQIRRFLILHKELDADDGELTRTRKVRRRIIAERYRSLVDALYSGAGSGRIETEMTFEDGRRGTVRAELAIRDVATAPAPTPTAPSAPARHAEAVA